MADERIKAALAGIAERINVKCARIALIKERHRLIMTVHRSGEAELHSQAQAKLLAHDLPWLCTALEASESARAALQTQIVLATTLSHGTDYLSGSPCKNHENMDIGGVCGGCLLVDRARDAEQQLATVTAQRNEFEIHFAAEQKQGMHWFTKATDLEQRLAVARRVVEEVIRLDDEDAGLCANDGLDVVNLLNDARAALKQLDSVAPPAAVQEEKE